MLLGKVKCNVLQSDGKRNKRLPQREWGQERERERGDDDGKK